MISVKKFPNNAEDYAQKVRKHNRRYENNMFLATPQKEFSVTDDFDRGRESRKIKLPYDQKMKSEKKYPNTEDHNLKKRKKKKKIRKMFGGS